MENERLACVDIVTVGRLLSARMSERLARVEVTLGQLPVLLALYAADGQTQAELARAVGVEQPTMALTLRRLERDGLVVRIPDVHDRRRALVRLTPRALAVREVVQAERAELDEIALAGLSAADRAELLRILAVMAANLERPAQ